MERYITENGNVVKYVHDDGSETAIKMTPGCVEYDNTLTGKRETVSDRNKYVVFISTSVGCPVKCRFCYLTLKKYPYHKLTKHQVFWNSWNAIKDFIELNPEAKNKYIKISYMGMGDLFLNPDFITISYNLIEMVIYNSFAKGVDGIDIGTVLPKIPTNNVLPSYIDLYTQLIRTRFEINPRNGDRNIFRIFYSLHTFEDELREQLIPFTFPSSINDDLAYLRYLEMLYPIDIIFHYMFMSGINDDIEDIHELIEDYEDYSLEDNEFRFLRLNECPLSRIRAPKEDHLDLIYSILNEKINKMKVQYSAGSEIKAACGQFIMRGMK